jgi:2,4-dienoyl-CoA reductase (NADPH2)
LLAPLDLGFTPHALTKDEALAALQEACCSVHLIGGADVAAELDAKRAINQGTRLASSI